MSNVGAIASEGSSGLSVSDPVFKRVTWRIVPILWLGYVLNYLDRTNLAFAQLQMKDQLGFSDAVFGLGASMTFIGLIAFEIPSNLVLTRIGARKTILRVLVLWGLCSAGFAFVTTPTSFYLLRFLAGVFEGGFIPGVIYYLTLWYPKNRLGTPTAMFYTAPACARIVAGPLAALFMVYLDGTLGLRGWQWVFILEGLPCLVVGAIAYVILSDHPTEAKWLSDEERSRLQSALEPRPAQSHGSLQDILPVLRNFRMWAVSIAGFLMLIALYGLTFWQPTLLKSAGLSIMQTGFFSAIPAALSVVVSVLIARRADRRANHASYVGFYTLLGAAGLLCMSLYTTNPAMIIVFLCIASVGMTTAYSLVQGYCGRVFNGTEGAAGIAIITVLQGSAGIAGPWGIAMIKTATGGFSLVLQIMAVLAIIAGLLFAVVFRRRGGPLAEGECRVPGAPG